MISFGKAAFAERAVHSQRRVDVGEGGWDFRSFSWSKLRGDDNPTDSIDPVVNGLRTLASLA